jgi:hypothetical protein
MRVFPGLDTKLTKLSIPGKYNVTPKNQFRSDYRLSYLPYGSSMWKRLIITSLLCSIPVGAWAIIKPVRVLAPQWVKGIDCINAEICIEDISRLQEATDLYQDSLKFISSAAGPFHKNPRVVFCSTEECFQNFGFKQASASTVGKSGIVISPRGWTSYYVRHEMIHHLQVEQLGILIHWLGPEWFVEGMAYSLSEDPRQPLSNPWEQYRTEFSTWYQKVGKEHLWKEAHNL